jgi:hypothetical protein
VGPLGRGGLGVWEGFAGGGEGAGEHGDRDVVVERGSGADLVGVQADQVVAVLVAFLDAPTGPGDGDHCVRAGGVRGVGQEIGHFGRVGGRPADRQGVGEPVGGWLVGQG